MKHIKLFEEFTQVDEKTMTSNLLYRYKDELRRIEGDILNQIDDLGIEDDDFEGVLGLLINQISKSVPSIKCK